VVAAFASLSFAFFLQFHSPICPIGTSGRLGKGARAPARRRGGADVRDGAVERDWTGHRVTVGLGLGLGLERGRGV